VRPESVEGGPAARQRFFAANRLNWTPADDLRPLVQRTIFLCLEQGTGSAPPAPHVAAVDAQDHWLPDDGYTWVVKPPSVGERDPGRQSTQHAHVVAAVQEGRWLPPDGYAFVTNPPPPANFSVRWGACRVSSEQPHIVAALAADRWAPGDGYVWITDPQRPRRETFE
jgi:hypothetical protein